VRSRFRGGRGKGWQSLRRWRGGEEDFSDEWNFHTSPHEWGKARKPYERAYALPGATFVYFNTSYGYVRGARRNVAVSNGLNVSPAARDSPPFRTPPNIFNSVSIRFRWPSFLFLHFFSVGLPGILVRCAAVRHERVTWGKTRLRTFVIGDTFLRYTIPYDFTWFLITPVLPQTLSIRGALFGVRFFQGAHPLVITRIITF
jgi:hypothetical protein